MIGGSMAVVIGTMAEAESGVLADRVEIRARRDDLIAIALGRGDGYCYVLMAPMPSMN